MFLLKESGRLSALNCHFELLSFLIVAAAGKLWKSVFCFMSQVVSISKTNLKQTWRIKQFSANTYTLYYGMSENCTRVFAINSVSVCILII